MMTGAGMAEAIRIAMGFPLPLSAQLQGWGSGVVTHIQSFGTVSNASGTVTGIAPPSGGPLISGAATNGMIAGMSGAGMASSVQSGAGYPSVSSELATFCAEIVSHIQTLGRVTFTSGSITGVCTNTPITPGVLTAGAGTGGTISLLDGSALASAIHSAVGYPGSVSPELINFCTAIVEYIMDNAVVAYAPGSVTAVCPAGGGPITAGAATGGTIA